MGARESAESRSPARKTELIKLPLGGRRRQWKKPAGLGCEPLAGARTPAGRVTSRPPPRAGPADGSRGGWGPRQPPRVMDTRRAHKTHGREEEQDGENSGVCPRVPPPSPRGAPQTQLAHTVPPPACTPSPFPEPGAHVRAGRLLSAGCKVSKLCPSRLTGGQLGTPGDSWGHLGAAGDTWGQQAERLVGKTEGAAAGAPWGERTLG